MLFANGPLAMYFRTNKSEPMNIEPLLQSSLIIQLHAFAAVLAVLVGPIALWRRSRDVWHRVAGYVWVSAMLFVAISSFWIHSLSLVGPFGPIHLLSVLVIFSVTEAIWAIRNGNVAKHQSNMRSLYFWALMITGLATLLPGRTMHAVLMPDLPTPWNWLVVPAMAFALILYRFRRRFLPLGKVRGLD